MPIPIVLGAIAAGAYIAKELSSYKAEQSQIKQIDEQGKLTRLQYIQKTIANYDSIERLLATQEAQASVRGYSIDSPSFNAIQRNSFNTAARQQTNLDVEEDIHRKNTNYEKENVKDAFTASVFGDASTAAVQAYEFQSSIPS